MAGSPAPDTRFTAPQPRLGGMDAILLIASCILLFTGLGMRSLWYLEGRWAEVTREMFLTGDFFHPMIGGEPYFDKPLLTYWLVAAVTVITGRLDEWAVRVPSAVSGLVTIVSTMWIGRQLWSVRVGRVAAAILLTSYGFLFWSRTANADLENLAAITLAIAWYWAKRDRPGFGAFLVFYLIVFVGALTKGLPAIVVPLLAVLTDVAINNRWRHVLRPSHAVAVAVGLLVYLAPFWFAHRTNPDAYAASGLALVFRENILRFFRPFDHRGPVYLYLYYLPALLMPWAPLFVAAVIGLIMIWRDLGEKTRWLLCAAAVIFAFFTASGSRRGYYILPLLPFCALMIALFTVHLADSRLARARRWGTAAQTILLVLVIIAELAGFAARHVVQARLPFTLPSQLFTAMLAVGVAAAAVGLIICLFGRIESIGPHQRLWALIAMAGVVMGGFFCWQQGVVETYRTERPFAERLNAAVTDVPPGRIGFFRTASANMFFYLGKNKPPAVLRSARMLREFLAQEGDKAVITERRYMADARSVAPDVLTEKPQLAEALDPWGGQESRECWVAWLVEETRHGQSPDLPSSEVDNEE